MRQPPMVAKTVTIVCEGSCNPYLADYDAISHRQAQFGDVKRYLVERTRQLIHTPHVMVQDNYYDVKMGWVRKFKCTVCGHTRRF